MTVEELDRFMDKAFPQMHEGGRLNVIEEVGPGTARLRLRYSDRNLRPGGTISGPAMMALADYAMYAVVLAHIGPVALAVTTNLSNNFLRKLMLRLVVTASATGPICASTTAYMA